MTVRGDQMNHSSPRDVEEQNLAFAPADGRRPHRHATAAWSNVHREHPDNRVRMTSLFQFLSSLLTRFLTAFCSHVVDTFPSLQHFVGVFCLRVGVCVKFQLFLKQSETYKPQNVNARTV